MTDGPTFPLVSYAQNREDLFLWGLLAHRTPGTYVDVGCYDERVHSVTRLFYEQGWSGVNIDANAEFAAGYATARERDHFVNAGVGAAPGSFTFRRYPHQRGLSTFDARLKDQHLGSGYVYEDVSVPIRTLDDILRECGVDRIDFLKIDVEGMEPEVLQGLDLDAIRPGVVVIEVGRTPECEDILFPKAYRREFFDGLNIYYVDEQATDLTIYNYAGRVLHQAFVTAREAELMSRIEELESMRPWRITAEVTRDRARRLVGDGRLVASRARWRVSRALAGRRGRNAG